MTEQSDKPADTVEGTAPRMAPDTAAKRDAMKGTELSGVAILWLAKAILFVACASILWHNLADLHKNVLPNQSGLSDLDRMEIFFYGLWLLLSWRYFAKTVLHQASPPRALYRYVMAFGIHAMFFAYIGVVLAPYMSASVIASDDFHDAVTIASELTWLLLLFAIVPKGVMVIPEISPNDVPDQENENRA